MFSPATYQHLFALYNVQVWPAQLLALPLGLWVLWVLTRHPARWRTTCLLVATRRRSAPWACCCNCGGTAPGKGQAVPWLLPLLWCAASATTLWTLAMPSWAWLAAAPLLALAALALPTSWRR